MRILIVSGGNIQTDFALDFLKKNAYDCVIAVDKGAAFCHACKIRPDMLTGDFDTLSPEILEHFEGQGIPVRRFRPEKDETDIELALGIAKERIEEAERLGGAPGITILGGTGSRLDHMLGTLYAMAGLGPECPCELVDASNRVRLLWPGTHRIRRADCFGPYLSLLPIGGEALGVTLRGMCYPLTEHTMTCHDSLGVSNEIREEEGVIIFREGVLACFETRD